MAHGPAKGSLYSAETYTRPIAIFRFLETIVVPVQKKGLTHPASNDNVHLGTRKSVVFRPQRSSSNRDGRPFRNQPGSDWGPSRSSGGISPQDGSNAAFEANSFERSDLKKAELASESNASVPGRLRLTRWGPVPDCDRRTPIPRRSHTQSGAQNTEGSHLRLRRGKRKLLCARI
jgi:hypothetical protein